MIESDRCFLREWQLSDACAIFLLNADDRVMRYTGDPPFRSVGCAFSFLQNYQDTYNEYGLGRMAILRKSDGKNLGWCGFKRHPDGSIDLGFRLFYSEWGKGYAYEAAMACLHTAKKHYNFKKIIARAHPENKRSQALLKRLGFVQSNEIRYIFSEEFTCYGLIL